MEPKAFDLLSCGLLFCLPRAISFVTREKLVFFNVPLSIHCSSRPLFGHFPRARVLLAKPEPWGHRLGYRALCSPPPLSAGGH